ncbi:MAG: FecR domain-containing protein [Sedimentisphaerales bacterium]|nr:FecR domain-containing protein [Sedimentisphaerales bacterium]
MNRFSSERELINLLGEMRDEQLSPEKVRRLEELLIDHPERQRYYIEHAFLCTDLHFQYIGPTINDVMHTLGSQQDSSEELDFFRKVIEEDLALASSVIENKQEQTYAERKNYISKRLTRKNIFSFLLKAAAVLMFSLAMIYLDSLLKREKTKPQIVAMVSDSINAKWGNSASISPGSWLYADGMPLSLQEGLVKVRFDQGADVILEAPCEFKLLSTNKMNLNQGRLYAKVTPKGYGFTVVAPGCTIVDLGTEFGVIATTEGLSEAHVLEGQVELWEQTASGRNPTSYHLHKGQIGSFSREGKVHIESRPARSTAFIREIPQEITASIPGRILDLADIVGGGNGFGSGLLGWAIDPETGKQLDASLAAEWILERHRKEAKFGNGDYIPVTWSPYIDGVFIPHIENGEAQINSLGYRHSFTSFAGKFYCFAPVINGGFVNKNYSDPIVMQGITYGTKEHPAISLHSAMGITFDLQALRNHNPSLRISRFETLCGISETVANDKDWDRAGHGEVEFWIFLDNRLIEQFLLQEMDFRRIHLDIPEQTRFLTLSCTQGYSFEKDWSVFGRPVLILEPQK